MRVSACLCVCACACFFVASETENHVFPCTQQDIPVLPDGLQSITVTSQTHSGSVSFGSATSVRMELSCHTATPSAYSQAPCGASSVILHLVHHDAE